MSKANEPAFPALTATRYYIGMTIREWYAGMALQGILANSQWSLAILKEAKEKGYDQSDTFAKATIELADAMIAELEKTNPQR